MRMWKSILFFLLSCVFSAVVFAQTASVTLSQLLKNMQSVQADFTQSIIDKHGRTLQKSIGKMSIQRPSRFRWDVTKPIAQLVVTNGVRLWVYDPDLEQVTIRSLVKAAGETPALLLSDENLSLSNEFVVTETNGAGTASQWFLLVPKDKNSMLSSLKLGFSNGEIKEMQLQDHLGHVTFIEFKNVKMNHELSAALFQFKPPANIDVIDETKR